MHSAEAITRVDLTGPAGSPLYAEILTPGGVVTVSVGAIDTRTGQPVVIVEIGRQVPERPNTRYAGAHAVPAGTWDAKVIENLGSTRVDVVLTPRTEGTGR